MDKNGYMTGIDSMFFDNPQIVSKEGTQGMAYDVYHITVYLFISGHVPKYVVLANETDLKPRGFVPVYSGRKFKDRYN